MWRRFAPGSSPSATCAALRNNSLLFALLRKGRTDSVRCRLDPSNMRRVQQRPIVTWSTRIARDRDIGLLWECELAAVECVERLVGGQRRRSLTVPEPVDRRIKSAFRPGRSR